MKAIFSLGLTLLALSPVRAQVFRPHREDYRPSVSVGVGYSNHGYRGGHHRGGHHGRGYAGPGHHSNYYGSYGSGYGFFPAYGYYDGYGPGYLSYDSYDHGTYRGSAAGSGLLLGALAGGIIGHNSGDFRHNGWRGAAWGAGAGWLLGTIADASRPRVSYPQPTVVQQAPLVQAEPAMLPPAAQPVTIINNYYNTSTPMSTANGMFGR